MFPFDIDDEELDDDDSEEETLRDYEIDLNTGKLTGRMIEGLDVIKQRIYIILKTDRYFFQQYSWDHGCELGTLIGQNYNPDYIESEAKRMIIEALSNEENIDDVTDFNISMGNDRLTVGFTAHTPYGDAEVSNDV